MVGSNYTGTQLPTDLTLTWDSSRNTCEYINTLIHQGNHNQFSDELTAIRKAFLIRKEIFTEFKIFINKLNPLLLKPMHLRCIPLDGRGWGNK